MNNKRLAAAFLRLYNELRDTPDRPSQQDRRLAQELANSGLDYQLLKAALTMAAARRTFRQTHREPLQPIRSLAYFLPVIDELRDQPINSDYLNYIERKLQHAGR